MHTPSTINETNGMRNEKCTFIFIDKMGKFGEDVPFQRSQKADKNVIITNVIMISTYNLTDTFSYQVELDETRPSRDQILAVMYKLII